MKEYTKEERNVIYKTILFEFEKVQNSHNNKHLSFEVSTYFLLCNLDVNSFPEIIKYKPKDAGAPHLIYEGNWFKERNSKEAIEIHRNILHAAIRETETICKNPYKIGSDMNWRTEDYHLQEAWDICNSCQSKENNCHDKHAENSKHNIISTVQFIRHHIERESKEKVLKEIEEVLHGLGLKITTTKTNKMDNQDYVLESGVTLIAKERKEQLEKHSKTLEMDKTNYPNKQLMEAARELMVGRSSTHSQLRDSMGKAVDKSYKERLIIAGALIAAEYDRVSS